MRMSVSAAPSTFHTIACRTCGAINLIWGIGLCIVGLLAIAARSTGITFSGLFNNPDSVPVLYIPFVIIVGMTMIVIGIKVFRRNVAAAVALLVFGLVSDIITYVVPSFNFDGRLNYAAGNIASDLLTNSFFALLTAIILYTRPARH